MGCFRGSIFRVGKSHSIWRVAKLQTAVPMCLSPRQSDGCQGLFGRGLFGRGLATSFRTGTRKAVPASALAIRYVLHLSCVAAPAAVCFRGELETATLEAGSRTARLCKSARGMSVMPVADAVADAPTKACCERVQRAKFATTPSSTPHIEAAHTIATMSLLPSLRHTRPHACPGTRKLIQKQRAASRGELRCDSPKTTLAGWS